MTDFTLTHQHQLILAMLRDSKALITPMIARELGVTRRHTLRLLLQLEQAGLIRRMVYTQREAGAPPLLWRLNQRGASFVGLDHLGSHYYRIPTTDLLAHRDLEREVVRQVQARADWQILSPHHPAPPPGETAQTLRLRQALLSQAGSIRPSLQGLIPPRCNDFVAWTDDGQHTALLILHPPRATLRFWTRRRAPVNSRAHRPPPPGRLSLYEPLARQWPDHIAAVFPDEATADPYIEHIEKAGLLVLVARPAAEITAFLAALQRGDAL